MRKKNFVLKPEMLPPSLEVAAQNVAARKKCRIINLAKGISFYPSSFRKCSSLFHPNIFFLRSPHHRQKLLLIFFERTFSLMKVFKQFQPSLGFSFNLLELCILCAENEHAETFAFQYSGGELIAS